MFMTNKLSEAMQNILCLGVTWLEKNLILDNILVLKIKYAKFTIFISHVENVGWKRNCSFLKLISKTIIGLPT